MLRSRHLIFLLTLILLNAAGFADNKGKEAAALIERAKHLSDLRAEGAPAFRLKSGFTITRDDGTKIEGVYTETWVSSKLWRREVASGDFRRIVVGKGTKSWQLDNSEPPKGIGSVEHLAGFDLDSSWFTAERWKPKGIEDRASGSWPLRCIETSLDPMGGLSELCFDKSNGQLVAQSSPAHSERSQTVESTCTYAGYQRLGERLFPWLIQCSVDREPRSEAKVIELNFESSPDAALFEPPLGGRESVNCQQVRIAPRLVYKPHLSNPGLGPNPRNPVILSVLIGTDGKPRDVKVTSSAGEAFDQAALEAVRRWRFNPATCGGEPIEMPIDVEVAFR